MDALCTHVTGSKTACGMRSDLRLFPPAVEAPWMNSSRGTAADRLGLLGCFRPGVCRMNWVEEMLSLNRSDSVGPRHT